jgi:D-alanyl-D-alanine carboxypeptidase/D-alanyl-D-alanine-endopeptidase (penicillin-binding protein 4)
MPAGALVLGLAFGLLGAAPIVQPVAGTSAWASDDVAKLGADLDAMIAASPALRGAHFGIYAVDTATGDVLYDRDADREIQPASTLKLVVGSAALDDLRPAFAFRTTLAFASEPGVDGSRSLVMTMAGDPTFSYADVKQALQALPAGPIDAAYVDDSAFDDRPYPAGWTWDDFAQDYAPSVSAATLDENVVSLDVAPGAKVGERARVRFDDGRPFKIALDRSCDPAANDLIVVARATTGAAGSDDTIDVARTPDGCPKIIGSIPLGAAPESIGAAVPNPLVAVHLAILRALAPAVVTRATPALGTGAIETYVRPPERLLVKAPFWTHDSRPLSELLGPRFWVPSDNLFGELLLKELGLATRGKPGTTDKGIATEKAWLRSIGVDTATVTLADGCGMSQYDRITPHDLVTILQHDWNGPDHQLVLDSLPVGGARGTIEGIAGTPAAGRVFAKTGSMMHVRGLAGYLATVQHGAVTFAFNVDDWNGDYPSLAALRAQVLSRIVTDGS